MASSEEKLRFSISNESFLKLYPRHKEEDWCTWWKWKVKVRLDQDHRNRAVAHILGVTMHWHIQHSRKQIVELTRSKNDIFLFESMDYSGWGTFVIDFDVRFEAKNRGVQEVKLQHELVFNHGQVHQTCHYVAINQHQEANSPSHSLVTEPTRHSKRKKARKPISPSKWSISYQQLMLLDKQALERFGKEGYRTKTMRDICVAFIEPSCERTGTSYALALNEDGLEVDVFVSHSWDGYFAEFVRSIRDAFQMTVRKPNLWICAFALIQGRDEDTISQQLGTDKDPLENTPFVQALKAASTFCVVRNPIMDVYGRIWCVCELMYAKQYGLFPDRTHVTGPDVFAQLKTTVLDAQATQLCDRDRILRVLLTEHNREVIDQIVHQLRTQEAPQEIEFEDPMVL